MVVLVVAALIVQTIHYPGIAAAIMVANLSAYAVAAVAAIRAVVLACRGIYRCNGLDPDHVRKLPKNQLFDADAFDAWLDIV